MQALHGILNPHAGEGRFTLEREAPCAELAPFVERYWSVRWDLRGQPPHAQETLEAEDFHWLGRQLHSFGLPVFNVLEGGYSDDLPELIFAYLQGAAGK